MEVLPFLISWVINFVVITILVGAMDEIRNVGIERYPRLAFFLAVGLPTLGEFLSWWFYGSPMISF